MKSLLGAMMFQMIIGREALNSRYENPEKLKRTHDSAHAWFHPIT
jgi:hypothetical protein